MTGAQTGCSFSQRSAFAFLAVTMIALSASCAPQTAASPTGTLANLRSPAPTSRPSATPIPTNTLEPCPNGGIHPPEHPWVCVYPTRTPTAMANATVQPTVTPYVLPPLTGIYAGTPLPEAQSLISKESIADLAIVGEWGRGAILGMGFVPGSSEFVVGSAFGIAVYDARTPEDPPRWVPLTPPNFYESLYFSADGEWILLEGYSGNQVRRFSDGALSRTPPDPNWIRSSELSEFWGSVLVTSPDQRLRLESHSINSEEWFEIEYSVREIYDNQTNEVLFLLPDETIQITYEERKDPEGCDLRSFEIDGNATAPAAMHPYRAGFSADGRFFAILYRAPNLWNSKKFSTLRVYDSLDGNLIGMIGTNQKPVETFAFSDTSDQLLVGYVDGTVQIWDPVASLSVFTASHFAGPIIGMEFSPSGKFVLVQRPGILEVRRVSDGALRSKYNVSTFAISPVDDLVALGMNNGTIQILELKTGLSSIRIQAHDMIVYALAFSPDGKTLVSSSEDCRVLGWNTRTGRLQRSYAVNWAEPYEDFGMSPSRVFIYGLQFVYDQSLLIGFGSWGRVTGWDADQGTTRFFFEPAQLEYYSGMMTLKPHFPEFARIDQKREVFYIEGVAYSLETGEKIAPENPISAPPEGCTGDGAQLQGNDLLITVGYDDHEGELCILDSRDLSLISTVRVLEDPDAVVIIWPLLSPDRERLLLPLTNGGIYVLQIE